jgi:hypothetical protein
VVGLMALAFFVIFTYSMMAQLEALRLQEIVSAAHQKWFKEQFESEKKSNMDVHDVGDGG